MIQFHDYPPGVLPALHETEGLFHMSDGINVQRLRSRNKSLSCQFHYRFKQFATQTRSTEENVIKIDLGKALVLAETTHGQGGVSTDVHLADLYESAVGRKAFPACCEAFPRKGVKNDLKTDCEVSSPASIYRVIVFRLTSTPCPSVMRWMPCLKDVSRL